MFLFPAFPAVLIFALHINIAPVFTGLSSLLALSVVEFNYAALAL
jgi:hypothetical protein